MALPALELSLDTPRILLLSLHPHYARSFFEGEKKIELRRTKPRVSKDDFVVFYVTSPVQAVCGGGLVTELIELPPRALWGKASMEAGIDRSSFNEYFAGASIGYGIRFGKVWEFGHPLGTREIVARWPRFRPPQLFQYLTPREARKLGVIVENKRLRTCGLSAVVDHLD